MMTTSKTVYTNDRGEILTEEEHAEWCGREEAAQIVRHLGYVPLPADDD